MLNVNPVQISHWKKGCPLGFPDSEMPIAISAIAHRKKQLYKTPFLFRRCNIGNLVIAQSLNCLCHWLLIAEVAGLNRWGCWDRCTLKHSLLNRSMLLQFFTRCAVGIMFSTSSTGYTSTLWALDITWALVRKLWGKLNQRPSEEW